LLVMGAGFIAQARREVLNREQVITLVNQAMSRLTPTPEVTELKVRRCRGGRGQYELAGKLAVGSLCHGQLEGQWNAVTRHLDLACQARLDTRPAGPPIFAATCAADPPNCGSGDWRIVGKCQLAAPLPR
jgi:hypothetical protein